MRDEFIATSNFQKTEGFVHELLGPPQGADIIAITGLTGFGKTTACHRIYVTNKQTILVYYREGMSFTELLREITYLLCGKRPRFSQSCFEVIREEMANRRRLIMVDEIDRADLKCFNILRNIHDILKIPILLIGENALTTKLEREPRLISRLRGIVRFEPVSQADIVVFYKKAAGLTVNPEHATKLLINSNGSFRNVSTDAVKIERMMKASGIESITDRIIDEICKNGHPQ